MSTKNIFTANKNNVKQAGEFIFVKFHQLLIVLIVCTMLIDSSFLLASSSVKEKKLK